MTARKARPEPAPEEPPAVATATTQDASLEPSVEQLRRALQIVQTEMLRQARVRSWCSEYETFVEETNAKVGFPVLGQRIRRQSINYQFTLRLRGTAVAIERAQYAFNKYIANFEYPELLDIEVQQLSDTWGVTQDEGLNGIIADHGVVDGLVVAGCNCETCQAERRAAREQAALRPRFT